MFAMNRFDVQVWHDWAGIIGMLGFFATITALYWIRVTKR